VFGAVMMKIFDRVMVFDRVKEWVELTVQLI